MAHPDSFSSNARYSSGTSMVVRTTRAAGAQVGVGLQRRPACSPRGTAAAVGLLAQERAALNEARFSNLRRSLSTSR